jgi:hypothetical protein
VLAVLGNKNSKNSKNSKREGPVAAMHSDRLEVAVAPVDSLWML